MWTLKNKISIGNYQFDQVVNVKIEKSSRLLADTAVIEFPLSAVFENKQKLSIEKKIKRGNPVSIEFGYDDELNLEFSGYVKNVQAKNNKTIIECEDDAYLLRKSLPNKAFKKTTLKEIVKYIANNSSLELSADIPDISISDLIIKNTTGLQALKKIKDNYGLQAFIDYEGKLFIGLAYTYNTGDVIYNLQKNIIKSNLQFKNSDDIKYKIKAISIQKDNSRLEVEIGDADGELRTIYFNEITSKIELENLANEEIKKYKYTGYKGTLTAFGQPLSKYGMSAKIIDDNYPQREGSYYVESVKTTFGINGFRRIPELGIKL